MNPTPSPAQIKFRVGLFAIRSTQHLHFHCNNCKNVFCLSVDDYPEVILPAGFMLSKIQLSAEGICDNCK
jgi:Fur family ferric uptake transcriptional regulator